MNVGTLRKVLEKIPDDYLVECNGAIINDTFEVDVSQEKLILKSLRK